MSDNEAEAMSTVAEIVGSEFSRRGLSYPSLSTRYAIAARILEALPCVGWVSVGMPPIDEQVWHVVGTSGGCMDETRTITIIAQPGSDA